MKALTVWQPWASLIADGLKPVENRDWRREFLIGQRIAIHAGKRFDEAAAMALAGLPHPVPHVVLKSKGIRGAIVCTAVVDRYVSRVNIEVADVLDPPLRSLFMWFSGPVGWVLRDVRAVGPIRCRGAQGLWDVPADVLSQIGGGP